jgi:hypothetical protein
VRLQPNLNALVQWRLAQIDVAYDSRRRVKTDAEGDQPGLRLLAAPGGRPRGSINGEARCFPDKYATARAGLLHLGGVIVLARQAGRMDKCFSGLLDTNANGIHAAEMLLLIDDVL